MSETIKNVLAGLAVMMVAVSPFIVAYMIFGFGGFIATVTAILVLVFAHGLGEEFRQR